MHSFNRRSLLQGGAAIALASAASTDALARRFEVDRVRINPAILRARAVLRRNVATMALNDPILESYRKAIHAMQQLPASDPRNWTKQAQIHLNHCPHGNWYFLPWHRAYRVAFERLCRQLSGNPKFALPYWDWTGHPQLPAAFATPTYNGKPNPLYNNTRSSQTVTIPSAYVGPTKISQILSETSFEVFGSARPNGQNSTSPSWQRRRSIEGPLESEPHDQTHVRVGGDMATFMSPLDPIFWLHHCNVDRLWDRWNNMGRANSNDNLWRTFSFNNQFVNPSGANGTTPYNTTVAGVLSIVNLGYRYTSPLLSFVTSLPLLRKKIDIFKPLAAARIAINVPLKMDAAHTAQLKLPAAQSRALMCAVAPINSLTATMAKPVQAPGRIIAIVHDVEFPKEGNADVRVFINSPDASPKTSLEDRHYAGSFTFFGATGDHMPGMKHSYLIDITDTVHSLNNAGIDLKNIDVQLVPVPIPGTAPASEIKAGSVEVAIF